MPVGCNLYFSNDDIKKVKASLKTGRSCHVEYETLSNGMEVLKCEADSFRSILDDPNHINFKVVKDWLNDQIAGNETLKQEYKDKLPGAIALVLNQTPDSLGFAVKIPKYRGKGSNALYGNLKHKTRGDAFAYEILGTAALIERTWVSTDKKTTLRIASTDRVDYGYKFQVKYAELPSGLEDQPKRLTIEADTCIQRRKGVVGIDFKHSRSGVYSSYSLDQLQGVKIAILNGECTEFNFVTNGKFSDGFKNAVATINQELDMADCELIEIFDEDHEKFRKIRLFENVNYYGR